MPAIVAAAIIAGGASVGGAAIASHAAGSASKKQSDAATRAAEIQAQSEREALAFKQQQAKQDQLNAETAQHANYDQWRARESRLSGMGSVLGLSPRQIPDYVPIPTGSGPTAAPTAAPSGSGSPAAGLVLMRAPNGQTKHVPASQQAYWTQKGATVMA